MLFSCKTPYFPTSRIGLAINRPKAVKAAVLGGLPLIYPFEYTLHSSLWPGCILN